MIKNFHFIKDYIKNFSEALEKAMKLTSYEKKYNSENLHLINKLKK